MTGRRTIRTYFDTGVVIAAFSSKSNAADVDLALELITDPSREIVTSGLLKLELLPSAMGVGDADQVDALQEFFDAADYYVAVDETLIERAIDEAAQLNGIGAIDALHLAAAISAGAREFITTEKRTKPLYRTRKIQVTHLYSI